MIRQSALLAAATLLLASPARAVDPGKAFAPDFGTSSPFFSLSNTVTVTYYGWEGTTVFGHTLWAFTASQFGSNSANGCFGWMPAATCAAVMGTTVAAKPYGASSSPYLPGQVPGPVVSSFGWTPGTEIIFAIAVDQGDGFNWFFSGSPSRNSDGLAHVAYFDPLLFPLGVPGNQGQGVVPQTAGLSLYGFEDVAYQYSDWDFDNVIFAIDQGITTETVPEPATMVLFGTGASAMAALRRRRRPTTT